MHWDRGGAGGGGRFNTHVCLYIMKSKSSVDSVGSVAILEFVVRSVAALRTRLDV